MELKDFDLKFTKARDKILKLLESSTDPLSAFDMFYLLDDKSINLSTIYRTLQTFEEKGMIIKDIRVDHKAVYTIKKMHHKHILICIKCNKKIYLNNCPFHKVYEDINQEYGFLVNDHNMELYGICKECQNKTKIFLEI